MPNMNDPADTTFYYTAPLFLPSTLDDNQFIGIYDSESALPTGQQPFTTAGIKGTGSMYVYLNNTWNYIGQYLHDAYRYLVYYQAASFVSATGTKWSSIFDDIAANATLMNEFANDNTAITNIASSSVAMNAVAASSTAMNVVAPSSTAMNAIATSSAAMNSIAASSTAMNAVGGSTTAMNAIMSGTQTETWWGSSYYVGKGLATYASLSHTDLDPLNTISDITASSTAMNDVAASSTAMNAVAASSTAMNAVAASSTAMDAVMSAYTAINAMTTLTAAQALQSSTLTPSVTTLITNINSGSMALDSTTTGSATTIGLNGLLTALSVDNGGAISMVTNSATTTLVTNIDTAFSSLEKSIACTTAGTIYQNGGSYTAGKIGSYALATNEIVLALYIIDSAPTSNGFFVMSNANSSTNMGYQANTANTKFYALQNDPGSNTLVSPLLTSGTLYGLVDNDANATVYYVSYTPA